MVGPVQWTNEARQKAIEETLDVVSEILRRERKSSYRRKWYKQLKAAQARLSAFIPRVSSLDGLFKKAYSSGSLHEHLYQHLELLGAIKKEQPTKWQQIRGWLSRLFKRGSPMPPGSKRSP